MTATIATTTTATTEAPAVLSLIGETPLVRLDAASQATGCEILGKAEFLNPGGSIKDRTALGLIRAAERDGRLRPGGTIVEGTAGNTGIGLAVVGNALGYKVVVVMPNTQSAEKRQALIALGCEIIEVDPAPFSSENHFVHYSRRLAEKLNTDPSHPNGAAWADQFDNTSNRDIHEATTGAEIWRQTEGKIDGFICAVGSGGTLNGVSKALRAHKPDIAIGLADPMGAALYNFYANGELKAEGSSITEGIGQGRITANLEGLDIDEPFQIPDAEALPIIFDLVLNEGHVLGGSSGINIAGAIRLAKKLGPGHTIVTMLCDYGTRYQSKMFNPAFLRERDLPVPTWLDTNGA